MLTTKKILKSIGNEHLDLQRGRGYFYFVFDDGVRFETRSVMTNSLSALPLSMWLFEARALLNEMEES